MNEGGAVDTPAGVATVAGWPGVRSFHAGRQGWYAHAPRQWTVYHRLGPEHTPGTASVEVTTYQFGRPDPDRTAFITDVQLVQRLLWEWVGDEPFTFPIGITIERSTPALPIDGERTQFLVVECERLWIAGVHLDDAAIIAVGRHYPSAELRLQFTAIAEIDGA